jgi:hypothetical protein
MYISDQDALLLLWLLLRSIPFAARRVCDPTQYLSTTVRRLRSEAIAHQTVNPSPLHRLD